MSDSKPRILFLPGVFLKDCPSPEEDTSEEIVELSSEDELDSIATDITQIETFTIKKTVIRQYDVIPTQFTSKEKWPKLSNLLCWYCDCSFVGMPWPVIIGCSKTLVSDDTDVTDISDASLLNAQSSFNEILIMDTHGNFCQPGCSMAYIDTVTDPAIINKHECKRLTMSLIEIFVGGHINYIPSSDPKTNMQKYCGPYGKTDDQYQNDNNQKTNRFTSAVEKSSLSSVTVKHL